MVLQISSKVSNNAITEHDSSKLFMELDSILVKEISREQASWANPSSSHILTKNSTILRSLGRKNSSPNDSGTPEGGKSSDIYHSLNSGSGDSEVDWGEEEGQSKSEESTADTVISNSLVEKYHGEIYRIFERGAFFGDLILDGDEDCKRTASAISLTEVDSVIVNQSDYIRFFKETKNRKDKEKLHILSQFIPEVKEMQRMEILPLIYSLKSIEAKKGEYLLKEEDIGAKLIILISGTVSIEKKANKQIFKNMMEKEEIIMRRKPIPEVFREEEFKMLTRDAQSDYLDILQSRAIHKI